MKPHVFNSTDAIWTVGHSNHPFEDFVKLLAAQGIEVVADVRSSPYARYAVQFNRESMAAMLQGFAIRYWYLGDLLGGRTEDERFYDSDGRVLYDQLARSPGFQRGIDQLIEETGCARVAICCGEENPTDCHRRLLVGRVLQERGLHVLHIRGDGRVQTEEELAAEENFRRTRGQKSLFDTEEPREWKSTQSVLPKRAPKNFSAFSTEPESGD